MKTSPLIASLFLCASLSAQTYSIHGQSIDSLLAQMTTREKATLCVGNGWSSMFMGIGMMHPSTRHHAVPGAAGETRAIPRLGIPSIVLSDGPAGVRICESTHLFPSGMNLANIRDTALIEQVGYAIGMDARAHGVHVMLAPGMNLTSNPLCGRNYEYYSADAGHSATVARAYIRGMQRAGVAATAKHYAMNNVEHNRMKYNFVTDTAAMFDTYLSNFEQVVRPASATPELSNPWCVMSSYNLVNGEYVQLSSYLLDSVLREQFRYPGVVMTDWMFYRHVPERVMAGNDLIMPGMRSYIGKIAKKVTPERLDEAARRILTLIAQTTAGEIRTIETLKTIGTLGTIDYPGVLRRAACASFVVLKSAPNPLTLNHKPSSIALYGTSGYHTIAGGTGSGFVRSSQIVNIHQGLADKGFTLSEGTRDLHLEWLRHKRNYQKIGGMSIVSENMGRRPAKFLTISEEQISRDAISADIAILAIGRLAGEGMDLSPEDLTLSSEEKATLQHISRHFHENGKNVLVLLNTPPYFETDSWQDLVDSIVFIGYPGEQAGNAVADFLTQQL